MAVAPSCTSAGVLGMARTTRGSPPSATSIRSVETPAATDTYSAVGLWPCSSARTLVRICGLTARSTTSAPAMAATLLAAVRTPSARAISAPFSGRRRVTVTRSGETPSPAVPKRPWRRARPMFPAPMIA